MSPQHTTDFFYDPKQLREDVVISLHALYRQCHHRQKGSLTTFTLCSGRTMIVIHIMQFHTMC